MPKALDPDARRAALALLARGIIRPHEAAELAGVTLQVMNHWLRRAGVDWERMRRRVLGNAWRKEIKRGPRLVESEPAATDLRSCKRCGVDAYGKRATRAAAIES